MQDAKYLAELANRFRNAACPEAKPGYELNEFGEYDHADLRNELISAYTDYTSKCTDVAEQSGAAYSLAGLLKRSLLLEQAKEVVQAQIRQADARRALPFMNLRARIAAIEGDDQVLAEMRTALSVAGTPPMWKLSDQDVESEKRKRVLLSTGTRG